MDAIGKLELTFKDGHVVLIDNPSLQQHESFMLEQLVSRLSKTQPESVLTIPTSQRITEPKIT